MIRSGNPALKSTAFMGQPITIGSSDTMTIQGTVNKSFIMLAILLLGAFFVWNQYFSGNETMVYPLMIGGVIGGLIMALVTVFKKQWSGVTAPLYAGFEGLALGGISAVLEARFPGIVVQAVGLTFAVFFALLMAYKSRVIQATENFKLGVAAATGGIFLVYLANFVLGFFGISVPYIHESGMIGIGFSVFVVIIAALNLVMDFDFIEEASQQRSPKYLEWFGAFGLMVTLVWLYIEILHLLAKLQSRD